MHYIKEYQFGKIELYGGGFYLKYKKEKKIELVAWLVSIILITTFVPKQKIREAHVSFLFLHLITWLFGLIVVEKKLIKYPFRTFFYRAYKSSFTFEYFVYPALSVLFNTHFPSNSKLFIKFLYFGLFTSTITLLEVIAVKYTKLISYVNWRWYWSFITLWFTFFLSNKYYRWFFQLPK